MAENQTVHKEVLQASSAALLQHFMKNFLLRQACNRVCFFTMRACLSFLLAIMLSLNAAYAATVGVCDALEHTSSQAAHLGHHEHSDDHAHDDPQVSADEAGKADSVSDHHHDHVHPNFSSILPGIIGVTPLTGRSPMVAIPAGAFVSAPQALPARPPRATLA